MPIIDLTGQKFGKLEVLKYVGLSKFKAATWECLCECGNKTIVNSNALRTGHTQSCGCSRKESTRAWLLKYNTKHNGSYSRLYSVWGGIKARLYNKKNSHYVYYGARGIKMCKEWRTDFNKFREWALSHGYDENAAYGACTIDRINVDGDYEPNNCRWVNLKVQANNKRKDIKNGTEIFENV